MIVKNWMQRDPVTVTSDTLVADANRILAEKHLRALPVVDKGRLRGLITRKMCLRAAEHAMRGQDAFELQYFAKRLKVKDLMVRNPKTVDAGDTMESCLRRGQSEGVSQFPVMDGHCVVGLVSATEIFSLAAHMLGVWDECFSMTLEPLAMDSGTLGRIVQTIESAGGACESIITVGRGPAAKRVVVRFSAADPGIVARALQSASLRVLELNSGAAPCTEARERTRGAVGR